MAKSPDDQRLELLQGTLDMLILRTLQWGPQHGHGIGQMIRQQSDDLLKVETGSLYPALHRLVRRGWLEACYAPGALGKLRALQVLHDPLGVFGRDAGAPETARLAG